MPHHKEHDAEAHTQQVPSARHGPGLGGLVVDVHFGLVDALAELGAGLRLGRLGRGLGVGGALLEVVELG